ncbi:MAG: ThiF family adenylyltransferase [Pirellulales bacterium]
MTAPTPIADRYVRQARFAPLGEEGQRALGDGRALVCGCGALGTVIANTLVRAGVGHVRIADRDFVELSNLQRQVLFDEQDVADGLPKAIAAAAKLRQINSTVTVEPVVVNVDHRNLPGLLDDIDVVLDGTDNFETRFLLNDAALKFRVPWVYGGCLGAEGQTMSIVPGQTPCLRCLIPEPPPPGSAPTCDTAGILAPVINVIASLQAAEAIKILSGHADQVSPWLTVIDVWESRLRQISLASLADRSACPTCSGTEYPWLDGGRLSQSAVLCGRNSVQLTFPESSRLNLAELANKLSAMGTVQANPFLVRCRLPEHTITVFPDGRAIIGGTEDEIEARALYARYVGH